MSGILEARPKKSENWATMTNPMAKMVSESEAANAET
jgi:hypothetical protein